MYRTDFDELPQDEQNILKQVYGTQSGYTLRKIDYVEELSDEEESFFGRDNLLSPNFFVQKLYKIAGNISPLKFNLAVSKLIEQTDELRTNYCQVIDRTLKVTFKNQNVLPEIIYRNFKDNADIDSTLKNIMEADMRKPFDLRYDNLFRFSVFKTGDEEFALLITLPKLIEESFDVKNFLRFALEMDRLIQNKKTFHASPEKSEPIQKYWANILQDLPRMPILPFSKISGKLYKQNAYLINLPAAIVSDLRAKSQSNRMMMMTIFQTAWGILLQEENKSRDTIFSTLLPDKTSEDTNSIPVRMKTDDEETLQNIVESQFKQNLLSMPFACKNFSTIKKIFQMRNKTLDHFLSFVDFLKEEKIYSEVRAAFDGTLVLQSSWNAQNTKLGIYFKYKNGDVSMSILYDKNRFQPNFGENIARRFSIVLQQMILDWNAKYKNFMSRLTERFDNEKEVVEEDTTYLRNFISQLNLLLGESSGTIQTLMDIAKLTTYFEGDRISGEEMEQNFIFTAKGKLVRSIESGDGWYNTLDIVRENSWINENILLENRKVKMSAEVLTERAILMSIPLEEMKKFIKDNQIVEHKILQHVLSEMEKYQRLWVQA